MLVRVRGRAGVKENSGADFEGGVFGGIIADCGAAQENSVEIKKNLGKINKLCGIVQIVRNQ